MPLQYLSESWQLVRTFRSRIGKTGVIFPAAFITAVGLSTMVVGIVFYASEALGASAGQVGALAATFSICYIAGCLFLRPVSSWILPRYSVLLATSVMALCMVFVLVSASLPWVFLWYGAIGLAACFFWPPLMGWLSTNIEGDELSRALGRFNLSWSGGVILGPLLAGWLSQMNPAWPLVFALVQFTFTAALILGAIFTLHNIGAEDDNHVEERGKQVVEDQSTPLRFPAWLGIFTAFVVQGTLVSVFPLMAQAELGFSKPAVGGLLLIRALTMTCCLGLLGRTSFWRFRGDVMIGVSLLLAGIAFLFVIAESMICVALLLVATGILSAAAYNNSLFHGLSGSSQRTSRMAMHEATLSVGIGLGAAGSGYAYQHLGMVGAFGLCAILLSAGAAVQAGMLAKMDG
ncbi:MAG: MFS transporter [Kiritimatiellales bacterium]|nr:MFS transporter [Kiritimatiellales bacterium]